MTAAVQKRTDEDKEAVLAKARDIVQDVIEKAKEEVQRRQDSGELGGSAAGARGEVNVIIKNQSKSTNYSSESEPADGEAPKRPERKKKNKTSVRDTNGQNVAKSPTTAASSSSPRALQRRAADEANKRQPCDSKTPQAKRRRVQETKTTEEVEHEGTNVNMQVDYLQEIFDIHL